MNKLIIPDIQPDLLNLEPYNKRVEEICLQLEAAHPEWLRLDEDTLSRIVENKEECHSKTFILPEKLIAKRRYASKINRLVAYMFSTARHYNWNFVVIASSLESLDKRVRIFTETVEEWSGNTA